MGGISIVSLCSTISNIIALFLYAQFQLKFEVNKMSLTCRGIYEKRQLQIVLKETPSNIKVIIINFRALSVNEPPPHGHKSCYNCSETVSVEQYQLPRTAISALLNFKTNLTVPRCGEQKTQNKNHEFSKKTRQNI